MEAKRYIDLLIIFLLLVTIFHFLKSDLENCDDCSFNYKNETLSSTKFFNLYQKVCFNNSYDIFSKMHNLSSNPTENWSRLLN